LLVRIRTPKSEVSTPEMKALQAARADAMKALVEANGTINPLQLEIHSSVAYGDISTSVVSFELQQEVLLGTTDVEVTGAGLVKE
jgi:hypothetical protein